MADEKNPSGATAPNNTLAETTEALKTNMARVGALMVSWPFLILPDKERDDAVGAATQLFTAVGDLHLGLVRTAARGLGLAARQLTRPAGGEAPAPHPTTTKVPIEGVPPAKR